MAQATSDEHPTKRAVLPFRLVPPNGPRRGLIRAFLPGLVALSALVGFVAGGVTDDLLKSVVAACVAFLLIILMCLRWFLTSREEQSLDDSVVLSAARIRCCALVEGDWSWAEVTPFRWVLQQKSRIATLVERSDDEQALPGIAARDFVVEAAEWRDVSAGQEAGYYSQPAIQFELDDLCSERPSRASADAVIAMLNRLREGAIAGTLRDGDEIEVPAFLTPLPLRAPAVRPLREATVAR